MTKTASDCTASGTGASTLTLVWNALGHLGAATRTGTGAVSETYGYDSSGRRLDKTSAGLTRHYLYDGDDIHAEWATTLSGAPAAVHVHGAGADEPLLRLSGATTSASAAQLAFVQDGLGSVVGVVSPTSTSLATNQRFDAWGNRSAGTGTIPLYGYTGREPDATGLTYYRARYYHPGIARFMSRDPAGMVDAMSPYAYVANNPVNLVDPFGLQAQLVTPGSQSSYPQNVQVAMGPVVAGATMTDVTAGVIGSGVGNQSLNGGRGAGSNVDPLAPQRDSGSGSSNPMSGALGQLGGFVNGALTGLGTLINSPGQAIENFKNNVFGNVLNQGADSGNRFPDRDLPRDRHGNPAPSPEAEGAHTQLGQKDGRNGRYDQAREFDANGKPVRDIDFTDHGRPGSHPNPHQHDYFPNPTGGTPQRGPTKPLGG